VSRAHWTRELDFDCAVRMVGSVGKARGAGNARPRKVEGEKEKATCSRRKSAPQTMTGLLTQTIVKN
jgi:hypothetical protein